MKRKSQDLTLRGLTLTPSFFVAVLFYLAKVHPSVCLIIQVPIYLIKGGITCEPPCIFPLVILYGTQHVKYSILVQIIY